MQVILKLKWGFLYGENIQVSGTMSCCCVVAKLYLTVCSPMDCSTPGFPVLHHLPEPAQTHVHWLGDAIQWSHPLSSLSPPASVFPSIRVFSNELALHIRWPKHWSFSISPSMNIQDWFPLEWTGWISLQSKGLSSVSSNSSPQFKSINSSVLGLLYSSMLTSLHDYWKNHSLD